jgi:hypothetical protein
MVTKRPFIDNIYIGLTIGIMFPILVFYLYYLAKYSSIEFSTYLRNLHTYRILFKIMSLCVLTDLPAFYLLMQFKHMRAARGVVMACFVYGFAVMGYRLFT